MFELIEEEIDGLVFGVRETADEGENLLKSFDFQAVASDLQLLLDLLSCMSRTHIDLDFHSLNLVNYFLHSSSL